MEHKIGQATTVEGFGEVVGIAAQGDRPNFKPYEPLPSGSPKDVFITSWIIRPHNADLSYRPSCALSPAV